MMKSRLSLRSSGSNRGTSTAGKGNEIFLLSRAIRESPEVLVCRIAGGQVTYVHRRLWPVLVLLAERFSRKSLAAIKEIHTTAGKHKVVMTPFPDWVPKEVLRAARGLQEQQATSQLAAILDERKNSNGFQDRAGVAPALSVAERRRGS